MTVGERIGGALLRRVPTKLLLLAGGVVLAWHSLRWLAAHWWLPGAVAFIGWVAWIIDGGSWWLLAIPVGIVLLMLGGWHQLHPGRGGAELLAAWRGWWRARWYRRAWESDMDGLQLIRADAVPTLERVEVRERDLDVLTVIMAPGQIVEDWRERNRRIRSTWGLRSARCHPLYGQSDRVQVFARRNVNPTTGRPVAARAADRDALAGDDQAEDLEQSPHPTSALPAQRPGAFPRTPTRRPR